jgi:CheY-like chemotaxis protein
MPKVLLVDDNIEMQKMLTVVLKKQGHEVLNADRGQTGIDMATSQPFNVIVLDVMMPDMNGYDVCRILRANPRTKDTPIIILTARAQPVDEQAALEAGADTYMAKPVDINELHNKIEELSNAGRPRPAPAPAPAAAAARPGTGPLTGAAFFSPPQPPPPPAGRLISVLCWRGGVGATTLALNLAGALLREGRRACLIDLSPSSGHAALMLRLRAKPNWTDLPADLNAQSLAFSLIKHESGLQVLASPTQPQTTGLTPELFNTVVQILFTFFTDVVVDCAPVLDPATGAALLASRRILLPLAPEVTSVQTMTGTLATMAALQVAPDSLRLVLNHPTPNPTLLPARIENALKRPLDAILPFDPAQSASLLQGSPLFMAQPKSPYMAGLATLMAKL